MNTKKTLIFLGVSLLLTLALSACGTEATPTPVVRENLEPDYVIAEGHVVPLVESWLSFPAQGRVAEVLVEEGDRVAKDQELARLADSESAAAALDSAQLELLSAQQAYDDFTRTADLAAAQAWQAYQQAQIQRAEAEKDWEDLDIDYLEDRIDDAKVDVRDREQDLEDAQEEMDKYQDVDKDNSFRKVAEDDLEAAQEDYNQAQRDLEKAQREIDGPRADLDAALAAEAEALREYQMWSEDGVDLDQQALLEARLTAAQAGLEAAQKAFDNYTLRAPFAGTLTDLYLEVGELVSPELRAGRLADLSEFQVQTSDLTELEVVRVEEGQEVEITPDALPELTLKGTVERIGQSFTTQAGDINYTVTVKLDETDPRLRWGMTVEVRFLQ
ncbi:MAG: HlyD family secretion protein [Anaerolineales bacterium]|jgi:multidrug efflux pump subunit AcrA (membrane-fusion protein)